MSYQNTVFQMFLHFVIVDKIFLTYSKRDLEKKN